MTTFFTEEQIKAEVERAKALVAQTKAEGTKAFAGSSFEQALPPQTRAITASDLQQPPSITPAEPKIDTTNYDALINGGNAQIGAMPTITESNIEPTSDLEKRIKALQTSLGVAPSSLEEAYKIAETKSDIDITRENAQVKQAQAKQAQAELAGIQAQIQAVVDKRDANFLKMEKEAEGRLISTPILSRQQAEVNRQAAIEALPLQALALAAQARVQTAQGEAEFAQSTLKAAQDKLDTAFQLKSKDIENTYNYAKENRDRVYDFLTAEQKTRADFLQKQDDRNFTLSRDAISIAQSAVKQAMDAGQADIAAKITQLPHPVVQSKTFSSDLAQYNNDIARLQGQIKVTGDGGADLKDFKQFFPNVNVATPEGRQQYLDWRARNAAATREPEKPTTYVPGTNPTVDNWAKLIISGQAKITDVPNPKGSTLRSDVTNAIATSGQLILSDKDREKLSTLDTAFNVYETIKNLSQKINTFGVVGRAAGFLGRYIGGATQYNTDIARYNAVRQGFVSNVARTLGEKGTLAEGDVQRAINNLPTVNDTEAVAQGKLETLRTILQGAKDSIVQTSTVPLTQITAGTLQNTPENLRTKYNY